MADHDGHLHQPGVAAFALEVAATDRRVARAEDIRADRRRRRAVGCANAGHVDPAQGLACPCIYCVPQLHLDALPADGEVGPSLAPRCICGRLTEAPGQRCTAHRTTPIVVCDDDPDLLTLLADLLEANP